MKHQLLTKLPVLILIPLAWLLFSIGMSVKSCDWMWLERSGSIVTLAGAAMATRPLLRLGVKEYVNEQAIVDGGHFVPTPEEIEKARQQIIDAKSSAIGFWFICIGTILWGYGSMIGPFVVQVFQVF